LKLQSASTHDVDEREVELAE